MARTPLSHVDLAWLRMDDPRNLMIITGFMTTEAPLSLAAIKAVVAGSLLKYDRFRQRVVIPDNPMRQPYWEDDPNFDLSVHLELVRLPPPSGHAELEAYIGQMMSMPLDYSRPLWKMYLIEQYNAEGGIQGSALVARLHHVIADGIALMHVLLSMASNDPKAPLPKPWKAKKVRSLPLPEGETGQTTGFDRMADLATDLAGKVSDETFKLITDPKYARRQARLGVSAAVALGKLVLRWPDPHTIFKGDPGPRKSASWSQPLSLDLVKKTGHTLDATVNDLLLSAVAGALRHYIQRRGGSVNELNIRGVIPVNLRPLDMAGQLGNQFGLVFLSLPLGVADPLERVHELKRRMDELKSTPEAVVAFGVLKIFGAVPEMIQDIGVQIFDTKGSAVMTNVPGPKEKLYIAGAPVGTVMAWVPQSGRVSLGVSIISYNGKVWLGIATDEEMVPDPQQIVAMFVEEFNHLVEMANQAPARPPSDISEMLKALDRAISKLEQVQASRQAAVEVQTSSPTSLPVEIKAAVSPGLPAAVVAPEPHCQAQTRDGRACRNKPLPGQALCRVHQK